MSKQEEVIQERIANYLVQNYPDVLFHSDYGSGAKLTKGQSAKQKRLNGGRRAWPDMFIAYTVCNVEYYPEGLLQTSSSDGWCGDQYGTVDTDHIISNFSIEHGLFLELKKEGENIYAQRKLDDPSKLSLDGKVYADKHIREQADVLYKLRQAGYCAEFAIGYDHAISIITDYLGEPEKQEVEF